MSTMNCADCVDREEERKGLLAEVDRLKAVSQVRERLAHHGPHVTTASGAECAAMLKEIDRLKMALAEERAWAERAYRALNETSGQHEGFASVLLAWPCSAEAIARKLAGEEER